MNSLQSTGNSGISLMSLDDGISTTSAGTSVTVMQGKNSGLSSDVVIVGGSIQVGSGSSIDCMGKTLGDIASEINSQGIAGVSAEIRDGKFTILSESGVQTISVSGDFARVSGMGDYTVNAGTTQDNSTTKTILTYTGSTTGLNGAENTLGGALTIGTQRFNAKGKTINDTIQEINTAFGKSGIEAKILDGAFVIESDTDISISATGDFARVSGMANYTVGSGTIETKTSGFIKEVNRLTEAEAIAQGYTVIKTAAQLKNISKPTTRR